MLPEEVPTERRCWAACSTSACSEVREPPDAAPRLARWSSAASVMPSRGGCKLSDVALNDSLSSCGRSPAAPMESRTWPQTESCDRRFPMASSDVASSPDLAPTESRGASAWLPLSCMASVALREACCAWAGSPACWLRSPTTCVLLESAPRQFCSWECRCSDILDPLPMLLAWECSEGCGSPSSLSTSRGCCELLALPAKESC